MVSWRHAYVATVQSEKKGIYTPSTDPANTHQKIMYSHTLLISSRHTAMTSACRTLGPLHFSIAQVLIQFIYRDLILQVYIPASTDVKRLRNPLLS
jgi:hypothetical protein